MLKKPVSTLENPFRMNKITQRQIKELALIVREEFYRYDGDESNLEAWCGDASYALMKFLHSLGYRNVKFCCGNFIIRNEDNPHCWLEVNNQILDITATQFGRYPAVWFPANPRNYQRELKSSNLDECILNETETTKVIERLRRLRRVLGKYA